ncbi:MAG: type III secretion system export apparatus subunit SctS [Desulfovibrio sp.]|nr:type III secretion system export apparatus subunit SctS [Desulfovibrio sp.]
MELAIDYAVKALYLVMVLSLPPIVVASVVGIVLSLIQAITQLQEQTLTFGVKLLAVGVTLFLMAGWLGGELLRYSADIFNRFYLL